MRHRLFVHMVWTTADRAPLIDVVKARFLAEQLSLIAAQERASVLALGMVSTHVHVLVRLHPSTAIPRLAQRLKGSTSHALRVNCRDFRWANGYTIQSVSEKALTAVANYVVEQSKHHPDEAIAGWLPR